MCERGTIYQYKVLEWGNVSDKNDLWKSTGLDGGNWDKLGAHNPKRETSMRPCHGIFTDQFIFRPVLARI